MITIVKGMFVMIILVAMVMILLGINRLFNESFQNEDVDTGHFRNEVNEKEEVLSVSNLFRRFLGR